MVNSFLDDRLHPALDVLAQFVWDLTPPVVVVERTDRDSELLVAEVHAVLHGLFEQLEEVPLRRHVVREALDQ